MRVDCLPEIRLVLCGNSAIFLGVRHKERAHRNGEKLSVQPPAPDIRKTIARRLRRATPVQSERPVREAYRSEEAIPQAAPLVRARVEVRAGAWGRSRHPLRPDQSLRLREVPAPAGDLTRR